MSVKIRLRRAGAKNEPHYRIIATDSRSPRDGKFLEVLGWYDPNQASGGAFDMKLDRVEHWIANGAIMSETVGRLVKKARKAAVAA